MSEQRRKTMMEHYNLDQEKVDKMINRAAQACLAYRNGEMTLKQVWYRARGERFMMASQYYADRELGGSLMELASDFFTEFYPTNDPSDADDFVIVDSIHRVLKHLESTQPNLH